MDQLPQADRAELERILMRAPFELTESEVAFLRARRDYLNFPQKQAFQEALNLPVEELAPEVQPSVPEQPTQFTDPAAAPAAPVQEAPAQPEQTQEVAATPEPSTQTTEEDNPYGVDAQEAEQLAQ